jgi:hypothetical protein
MAIKYKARPETVIGFGYVEDTIRGRIVGWMNNILSKIKSPFEFVDQQIEIKYPDGRTRKFPDIIIWEKKGSKAACLIEFKPPEGWTPYDYPLINDAQQKVTNASPQIPYFGTWNTNELVLWKTFDEEATSLIDRRKAIYEVVKIKSLREIDYPEIEQKIKEFLEKFLIELVDIYFAKKEIPKIPIDEFFIYNLRSVVDAFYTPISVEIQELMKKDKKFSKELIKWFVEQGWMPPTVNEDFERTARQFLYLLIDKIMFYNTLRIKFKSLKIIQLDKSIHSGIQLKKDLQRYLNEAEEVSGDYETIFSENFLENIPIPNKLAQNFVYFINGFSKNDFSKLGYKDIQKVYERLIPPTERHKLGQYFTRDDVVDFINGFCIKNPNAKIADFGCGTGTFLVRGYSRLHNMKSKDHVSLLNQLWGVDIAKFPSHLSTINLAVRDLGHIENYPKILNSDFFDIEIGKRFLFGPKKYKMKTLRRTFTKEEFPILDAVVGNPPYTRQEELEDYIAGYKKKLEDVLRRDWEEKIPLGKRASIYAYFFIHGLKFLRDGGRFGYVTSNSWLDVDYGKYLQEFFLNKTKIVAIIESKIERWFEDADINTEITILERCDDKKERESNVVKFVQLKVPLKELIPSTDNEKERWKIVDELVELIEKTNKFYEDERIRIRPKLQRELIEATNDEDKYIGTKWGTYVRAPKIFFEILRNSKDILTPFEKVAEVKRGFTTGANEFFYLTEDQIKKWRIEKEFWMHKSKDKWIPNYVVKSPRECKSILVESANLKYRVLLVHKDKKDLKGTNVLKYIKFGEQKHYDENPTCASRNRWYELGEFKGDLLCMMSLNNRHIFWINSDCLIDARFYEIYAKNKKLNMVLSSILNSSLTPLFTELIGRVNLGLGALDVKVYEYQQMKVIDPIRLSQSQIKKLETAFDKLAKRPVDSVFEEIGAKSPEEVSLDKVKPDRRELDKIIMGEILGLSEDEQLQVYRAVIDLVKSRMERAKSVEGRRKVGGVDVSALADSILQEIDISKLKFPDNFILGLETKEMKIPKGIPKIGGDLRGFFVSISEEKIRCKTQEEAKYIFYCAMNRKDRFEIPKDEKAIKKIVKEYQPLFNGFLKALTKGLESLIPDRKIRKAVEIETLKKVFGE